MGKKSNLKKARKEAISETIEKSKVPGEIPEPQAPRMREVLIQTDGTNIRIVKNTSAGNLELIAIFQALLGSLTSNPK